uniref:Internal scaffolding protein n=1 Tax=Dulem virus 109 TaxID=3145586 RepID=A0AAU8B216_9VIRU
MKFEHTLYRPYGRVHSNSGSPTKILYGSRYDDAGRLVLEEKGTEDLYGFIQSFADSVDIHVILKRFQNGDHTALQAVQGFYGDFTEMPKTYAELLNTVNAGQDYFSSLPVDVRANFGHSFAEFMASISDGSLAEKLGIMMENHAVSQLDPKPESVEITKEVTNES